jgi:hypothetical protein
MLRKVNARPYSHVCTRKELWQNMGGTRKCTIVDDTSGHKGLLIGSWLHVEEAE